ncbi:hypothetical protein AXG93_4485s1270 [Marchantia polymorpha subsp. ruderalis]|uniref:Uncharacterized protein n=1 Tax=Marchantia polymorpha subsp. ruderalis TaxID=1480154 RepID=A0A176WFF0_MARPO|nr:hypothetical protein AXG93_4485s1270 [Marchantia polymorpha subsp. ruderalis]
MHQADQVTTEVCSAPCEPRVRLGGQRRQDKRGPHEADICSRGRHWLNLKPASEIRRFPYSASSAFCLILNDLKQANMVATCSLKRDLNSEQDHVVIPSSESRLLPQEQLQQSGGLCGGYTESLLPTAAFLSSWSLHTGLDLNQLYSGAADRDMGLEGANLERTPPSLEKDNELLNNKLPSEYTRRILTDNNVLANTVLSSSSTPSSGRRNIFATDSEILSMLARPGGPSDGNHLIVEKRNHLHSRSKQYLDVANKIESPSNGNNLRVIKSHRSPPHSTSTTTVTRNLARARRASRSSPSQ